VSFRTDDDRALILTYEEWRRGQDEPDAMPVSELVATFIAEKEVK
jgi:hypothetical protein